jgi:hypothetical protein
MAHPNEDPVREGVTAFRGRTPAHWSASPLAGDSEFTLRDPPLGPRAHSGRFGGRRLGPDQSGGRPDLAVLYHLGTTSSPLTGSAE